MCPPKASEVAEFRAQEKSVRDKLTEADVLASSPCTANELWHTVRNKIYIYPLACKQELAKIEVTAIRIKSYRAFIV